MSYLSLLPAFERLPYRVVMVCTGNICRSAMAQIVLAQRLRELGVSEVVIFAGVVAGRSWMELSPRWTGYASEPRVGEPQGGHSNEAVTGKLSGH